MTSATPAPRLRQLRAQAKAELVLLTRNGEQLLLTVVIPALVLGVASHLRASSGHGSRLAVVVPGVLALAVLATAFTGQAIETGFQRRYGVLKRFAVTPLSRLVLVLGKTAAVVAVEAVQLTLLVVVALLLGWSPHGSALPVIGLLLAGTAALSGCGLLLAGTVRAEATLALANLIFLLLLVFGAVVVPLSAYGAAADALRCLPVAALADGLRAVLRDGTAVPAADWLSLGAWAAGSIALTSRAFRWQ